MFSRLAFHTRNRACVKSAQQESFRYIYTRFIKEKAKKLKVIATTYNCSRFTSLARVIGKLPVNRLEARCLQTHSFLKKIKPKTQMQNAIVDIYACRAKYMSYNLVRLVKLPSSSGIVPENWFASIPLQISSNYCNLNWSNQKGITSEKTVRESYKNFRFLKFCNQVGKFPDKRFPESQLRQENSKLLIKHA